MKKNVNGQLVEMTAEEIAKNAEFERIEATRQFTADEVLSLVIPSVINNVAMDDDTAIRCKDSHPLFDDYLGKTVNKGFRFREGDKLWKTKQSKYTFVDFQRPSLPGFESLFEEIPDKHSGIKTDPIPYNNNMELVKGLYYTQDGVLYLCTTGSGQAVYNPLKELIKIYVEVVE